MELIAEERVEVCTPCVDLSSIIASDDLVFDCKSPSFETADGEDFHGGSDIKQDRFHFHFLRQK